MRLGTHFTIEQRGRISAGDRLKAPMSDVTKAKIAIAHTGKPRPQSVLDALRNANLGSHPSEATRARMSLASKGKPKSAEHCARISAANMGKHDMRGSLNSNWQGGITEKSLAIRNSEDYDIWRSTVFIHDGFACRKCGDDAGHNLRAHHMDCFSDFPEKRMDVNNGITLCDACHVEFHHRYGVRHNRKWQTDEFMESE